MLFKSSFPSFLSPTLQITDYDFICLNKCKFLLGKSFKIHQHIYNVGVCTVRNLFCTKDNKNSKIECSSLEQCFRKQLNCIYTLKSYSIQFHIIIALCPLSNLHLKRKFVKLPVLQGKPMEAFCLFLQSSPKIDIMT